MITEIKHFIFLLIISLMPSEKNYFTEENNYNCTHQTVIGYHDNGFFTCLIEIKSSIIAKLSSENKEVLTKYDENKSNTFQKNEHAPHPYCIETSVRTVDWITHFRWNLRKLLADMSQKEFFWTELLPFQIYSNELFIPLLTYYVYTLEKITI